ncbi:MAG: phosphoribosylaminoimidazolesuccinocarboxamide synthase, partial [Planctomycetes bacterium]|nr:phosphoribosylaminoimidazolesuccinocarboxamide synthase [Planctomycetota bacterium]
IAFDRVVELVGRELAEQARAAAIALYTRGNEHANSRGIVIADTKFEFGLRDGELMLIDECLTPDSSRFWPSDQVVPGGKPKQYDKQHLRDWLLQQDWDKTPPPPPLPDDVVASTAATYREIQERLVR